MARSSLSDNGNCHRIIYLWSLDWGTPQQLNDENKKSCIPYPFFPNCLLFLNHFEPFLSLWCINGLLSKHVGSSAKICFLEKLGMNNLTVVTAQRWGEGFCHVIPVQVQKGSVSRWKETVAELWFPSRRFAVCKVMSLVFKHDKKNRQLGVKWQRQVSGGGAWPGDAWPGSVCQADIKG